VTGQKGKVCGRDVPPETGDIFHPMIMMRIMISCACRRLRVLDWNSRLKVCDVPHIRALDLQYCNPQTSFVLLMRLQICLEMV
jgi:hypothetical protein